MASNDTVRFKGTRNGVHLVVEPTADFQEMLVELDQRLKSTDQFFRSAAVMLNVGSREMDDDQMAALQGVLAKYGLSVVLAQASHTDTRSLFRGLGIPSEMPDAPSGVLFPDRPSEERGSRADSDEGMVVYRTLRSGQSLQHAGDICLIGDVNPGAEIVAGDNVIVWGSLRGVVQAGTRGNEHAVVCALELAPTQLRIASLVTRQPEPSGSEAVSVPEMARIVDGQIVVEQWLPRSRRVRTLRA